MQWSSYYRSSPGARQGSVSSVLCKSLLFPNLFNRLLVGYRELQNKAALLERTIGHYQQLPQDVLEPEVEILEGPTPAKTVRPDDDNSSTEATT